MKPFSTIAAVVFAIVALVHLLRLVYAWEVTFAGWVVPMWVSVLGLIVAGGLAAAAGGMLLLMHAEQAYLLGSLLIVIGSLVQDVAADAMSTEVVPRTDEAGKARPEHDIRAELGMDASVLSPHGRSRHDFEVLKGTASFADFHFNGLVFAYDY